MVRACVHRLAIVLAGCYSPSYRDCEITCAGQSCPSGLQCTDGVAAAAAAAQVLVAARRGSWQASGAVVIPPAVVN
jgi:hypothetical protein